MRTTHTRILGLALALAMGPLALARCGGSSGGSVTKSDGGSPGGSSGASGSSSGGGSGSSSGGAVTGDSGETSSGAGGNSGADGGASSGGEGGTGSSGGPAIPVPEGGAPSEPGSISCGSASCSSTTQFCCADTDGGTCLPSNSGACTIKVSCDEAADCSGGVCCQPLQLGPHSTTCLPSCGTANFQVCRTDAECGSADAGAASQRCIVQTCPVNMVGGTATVEACAYYNVGGFGALPGWGALPGCTAK